MLKLIKFSLKNSIVIVLSVIMLIIGGLYSAKQMKMEKYPDVTIPFFGIQVAYPGSTTEQAMQNIGVPLEQQLGNLPGKKLIHHCGSRVCKSDS